jgi:hypothetical protein
VLAANGKGEDDVQVDKYRPQGGSGLAGFGVGVLAVFSVAVVWLYFGQGNAITDGVVVLFGIFSLITLVERGRGKIRLGFGLRGGRRASCSSVSASARSRWRESSAPSGHWG